MNQQRFDEIGFRPKNSMFVKIANVVALYAKFKIYMPATDALRLLFQCYERSKHKDQRLIPLRLYKVGTVYIRSGSSDGHVVRQLFVDGGYEVRALQQFANVERIYNRMLSLGATPLIIDGGANVGLASVFFSTIFPMANIVAVEPAPDNVSVACRNASGRSINIIEAALHSHITRLSLRVDSAAWAYTTEPVSPGTEKMIEVETTTISSLVEQRTSESLLLVKLDIEGAESSVFEGDLSWMDKTPLIIIELHDWLFPGKGTSHSFFRALEGRSFEMHQHGENLFVFLDNSKQT